MSKPAEVFRLNKSVAGFLQGIIAGVAQASDGFLLLFVQMFVLPWVSGIMIQ